MVKKVRQTVELSEDAARLLSQIPQATDMPVLPNEQIEEVAEQVRKRLRQRVGLAKAEAWRREFEQMQKTGRVAIGPGLEGVLTEAGKETKRVSFFEILVDGRPFFGCEEFKPLLEGYLASIPGDTVDVTFLHSARVKLDEQAKAGRHKAKPVKEAQAAKPDRVNINCTVRVPKAMALSALEDKIMRTKELARIAAAIEEREQKEHAVASASPPNPSGVQSETSEKL